MFVTVSDGKDKALHLYELRPDSGKLVQYEKIRSARFTVIPVRQPERTTTIRLDAQRQQRDRLSY